MSERKDAYRIVAQTGNGRRELDTAKDRTEAEYLTEEYQLAYGPSVRITYIAIKDRR